MQCVYIKRDQTRCPVVVKKIGEDKCCAHRKSATKKKPVNITEDLKKEIKELEKVELKEPIKEPVKEPVKVEPIKESITEDLTLKLKNVKKIIVFKSQDAYINAMQLIDNFIVKK